MAIDFLATDPERQRGIASAYDKYLGRTIRPDEYQHWLGNANFEQEIQRSPEAQQYQSTRQPAQSASAGGYAQIPGFDYGKLQNTGYSSPKYTDSVRQFSQGLKRTGMQASQARGQLQRLVDDINANGGRARVVGDDRIDFGDGRGPIDVLTSWGSWWFNNQQGAGGTPGPSPIPSPGPPTPGPGPGPSPGPSPGPWPPSPPPGRPGPAPGPWPDYPPDRDWPEWGSKGGQTRVPGGPDADYAAQFDDPATKYLEDYATYRLDELGQPIDDPARESLAELLDQQTRDYQWQHQRQGLYGDYFRDQAGYAQDATGNQLDYLNLSAYGELMPGNPTDEYTDWLRQRAGQVQQPGNPSDRYASWLGGRAAQIQQPGNTTDEYSAWLRQQAGQLQAPDNPSDRYARWLGGRAEQIQQPGNQTEQYGNWLQGRARQIQQPGNAADQLSSWLGGEASRLQQPNTSSDEYVAFLKKRAGELLEPAYTGTEQEVLRTQALDPIERDRQAARQRSLQRIGSQGMDLNSGIAQQALNDVDAGYDRQRASAQGDLAYRQIAERRSRAQEAQGLLGAIPGVERAESRDIEGLLGQIPGVQRAQTGDIQGLLDLLPQLERAQGRDIEGLLGQIPEVQRGQTGDIQGLLDLLPQLERAQGRDLQQLLGQIPEVQRAQTGDIRELTEPIPGLQREQSAWVQSLLNAVPNIQRDATFRDQDLNATLDDAMNRLSGAAIGSAGQAAGLGQSVRDEEQSRRQEALSLATMLQQLPTYSLQQALSVIGMAPAPESLFNQALQLYQVGQQERNQGRDWYQMLGAGIPMVGEALGNYRRGQQAGGR